MNNVHTVASNTALIVSATCFNARKQKIVVGGCAWARCLVSLLPITLLSDITQLQACVQRTLSLPVSDDTKSALREGQNGTGSAVDSDRRSASCSLSLSA